MADGPEIRITKDYVPNLKKAIKQLLEKDVLVGVPEDKTDRPPDEDEPSPPTNATLAYIHDNGSPANNIPARPFMIPGMDSAKDDVVKAMAKAAQAALKGDGKGLEKYQMRAGQLAADQIKLRISEGIPPPLAQATLERRLARLKGKRRKGKYAKALQAAIASNAQDKATGTLPAGVTPLVDTGHLRRAITFAIRKKEK
jgi:hypothetical protein